MTTNTFIKAQNNTSKFNICSSFSFSAFVICIQLMLHSLQDPNKTKKKWLQWLKMCVRLQSWDYSISPLISTVAGSWWAFSTKLQMDLEKTETLKWMELHNLWRKMRHSLQSGGAILWWQWRSQSCSDLNTWRTFSCRPLRTMNDCR